MDTKGGKGQKSLFSERSQLKPLADRLDKTKKYEEEEINKKRLSIYSVEAAGTDQTSKQPSIKKILLNAAGSSRLIEKVQDSRGSQQTVNLQGGVELEEKAEISSSLIAQHFSILRELYQYTTLLKENLGTDLSTMNLEEAWRNIHRLIELLEAGCDFLNYPLKL